MANCYQLTKRGLDLLGSTIGLLFGFPLFLLIAFLIKLDSPGPVFFRQKRVGAKGKTFMMIKFRTMVANAEEILKRDPRLRRIYQKNSYKIKNDPRVTRVGRVLRKLSLDELPQLINILKGEMSLVGPRAYKPDELENQLKKHPQLKKYAQVVMEIKPGLTGVWQTSGRSEIGFEQRIKLDYSYARRQSLLFDLWLILKTIPVVLSSRGAW